VQNTLANQIYLIGTVLVSWLVLGRALMQQPRKPRYVALVGTLAFVVILYTFYTVLGWHPDWLRG